MGDAEIHLSGLEQDILLFCAKQFDSGQPRIYANQLPGFERSQSEVEAAIDRFANFGWLKWETNVGLLIYSDVMGIAHRLNNPPPRDYWQQISIWFRSKPWSVPVFVALVTLPLLVTWVEMIATLLRWLGVSR
jgi:hypothetical protein